MIKFLMVDDEIPSDKWDGKGNTPYVRYYREAAQMDGELKITAVSDFSIAKKMLNVAQVNFDVVSLDITMPFPGGDGTSMAKNGSRTGLVLLDIIIRRMHNLSVIILTNISPDVLHKDIPSSTGRIKKIVVLEKIKTDPFTFVDEVKELAKIR